MKKTYDEQIENEFFWTTNFISLIATSFLLDINEGIKIKAYEIRVDDNKLKPEIIEFIEIVGGMNKLYKLFCKFYYSEEEKNKCINLIKRYVYKYKVQPHRLRHWGYSNIYYKKADIQLMNVNEFVA